MVHARGGKEKRTRTGFIHLEARRKELRHSSGTHRGKEPRTRTGFIHVEARRKELGHGSYTWRQGEKN